MTDTNQPDQGGTTMKLSRLTAMLIALLAITTITTEASAMYHAGMGRFMQRDPLGTMNAPTAPRVGMAGPAAAGGFVARDPVPTRPQPGLQYADGMNLYQYVGSVPLQRVDPLGLAWTDCFGSPREKNGTICGYSIWLLTGSCCADPDVVLAAVDGYEDFVKCWWECEVNIHKCAATYVADAAGGAAAFTFTHGQFNKPSHLVRPGASELTTLQSRLSYELRSRGYSRLSKPLRLGARAAKARPIITGAQSAIAGAAVVEAGISVYCGWKCSGM